MNVYTVFTTIFSFHIFALSKKEGGGVKELTVIPVISYATTRQVMEGVAMQNALIKTINTKDDFKHHRKYCSIVP